MAEMDPGSQTVTVKLAELRMSVRPGHGLVARFPSAVLVVTGSDWTGLPAVDRLLEECAAEVNGRSLPHRLSELVDANPQKVPSFCAIADSDEGLALFVHGDAQVVITGAQPVVRLSGRDASGWTGRIHDRVASLVIGPAAGVADAVSADPHTDLKEGVVPGSAVVLTPRDTAIPERMDEPDTSAVPDSGGSPAAIAPAPNPAAVLPPAEPAPVPVSPATEPTQVMAPRAPDAPRVTVPVSPRPGATSVTVPVSTAPAGPAGVPAAAVDAAPPMVWGIHCKRGHFNNPDARYCRMCGTHMVHQRREPILGPRPVLGFLVMDDGSTFKLDVDYVLGHEPELDDSVRAGDARGLALSDPENAVSPVHARVHLDQWDVFVSDCESRYGTHVWAPGSAGWVRLKSGEKVKLEPGTHVLLGRRSIIFDSLNRR